MGSATAIEDADDGPFTFADMHHVADVRMLEASVDRTADHHFALPGSKPPSSENMDLRTHLDSQRSQKAGGDIGFSGAALARQHYNQDVFARDQGLPLTVPGDTGQF